MEATQHNGITPLTGSVTQLASENTALRSEVGRLEGMQRRLLDRIGQQDELIDQLLAETGYERE